MAHMDLDSLDNLGWLHGWYQRHCDGCWEYSLGLRLTRLEAHEQAPEKARGQAFASSRPGWRLIVELSGTGCSIMRPRTARIKSIDGGWLHCSLTPERFTGTCDPGRLEQVIGVFRRWVEHLPDRPAASPWAQVETAAGAGER